MRKIKFVILALALMLALSLGLASCAPEVSNIPDDLDLSGITLSSAEFIYDGEEHSLAVKGTLPEGVSVVYEGNSKKEVGSHTVTAKFYYQDEYIKGSDMKSTLTIKPLSAIDLSGVILAGKTAQYNGIAQYLAIDGVLPEGVTVEYVGNGKTDAGEHSVSAKFYYKGNYLEGKDKTATLTITKRDLSAEMYGVAFNSTTVVYNGEAHYIYIAGNLPDGVDVSYTGNGVSALGTHEVVASFTVDENNYVSIPDMTATITVVERVVGTVVPSDLDLSGVTLAGDTVTYNGEVHSLAISGNLPSDVTVLYIGNDKVNAGTYSVTAKFYYKGVYVEGKDLTATLKINKKVVTLSGISFENTTVIYDGKAHSIAIKGTLPVGVTVVYDGNEKTEIGEYTVTASFVVDTANYELVTSTYTATLIIEKRNEGVEVPSDLDLSGVTLAGDTVTYDGEVHSLAISGTLPSDVTVLYVGNDKVNAGTYSVTAKFYYKGVYVEGKDLTATLKINKKTVSLEGISFENTTVIYDGKAHSIAIEGTLPAGVSVVYDGNGRTEIGDYTVTARFVVDTANYNVIEDTYVATLSIIAEDSSGISSLSFADAEYVYDGTEKTFGVKGLALLGSNVTFMGYFDEGSDTPIAIYKQTNAGVYTVTAKFAVAGVHEPEFDMTATLTIKKAQIKVSAPQTEFNFVFDGNKKLPDALVWDGEKPACITVVAPDGKRLPGTYTLTYKFVVDEDVRDNYETKEITVTMTIAENPNLATEGLEFVKKADGTYFVKGYTGTDKAVIIPATYEGAAVTAIAYGAFANNTNIEYVKVPDSVIAIGQSAFRGCTSIEAITLPFIGGSHNTSNEYIGYIFGASDKGGNEQFVPASLKVVELSDACKLVPAYSFQYAKGIETIIVGKNVAEIGVSAFRGCTALREVYIPASVTTIRPVATANSAFYECSTELVVYLEAGTVPAEYTEAWCVVDASGNKVKVVTGVAR